MRRIFVSVTLVIAAATAAAAQGYKPMPGPPMMSLETTLRRAGNFNTFLSLLEGADLKALGVGVNDGRTDTAAGPGGGPRYQTLFVPNDSAFARLPIGTVEALKRDPARLRSFLLALSFAPTAAGQLSAPRPGGGRKGSTTNRLPPATGRFRVTVNGFIAYRQTWDDALQRDGKDDEVFLLSETRLVQRTNDVPRITTLPQARSLQLGDIQGFETRRLRAGSASDLGGIRTGDRVPVEELHIAQLEFRGGERLRGFYTVCLKVEPPRSPAPPRGE